MINPIVILGFALLNSTAQAAWPDPSKGRIYAVGVFRRDLKSPNNGLVGEERTSEYKKACKLKYYPACNYKKWTTEDGLSDLQAAGEFFGSRCKSEGLSCVVSGWANGYVDGQPSQEAINPEKAFADLSFGCNKKSYGPACAHLGEMVLAGVGTEADPQRALDLFQEACKAKDAYGCYIEGDIQYRNEEFAIALKKYRIGCAHEYTEACVKVGSMYDKGQGVQSDPKEALSYYEQACELQDTSACYQAAVLYKEGRGSTVNLTAATQLFQRACQRNHPLACGEYGAYLLEQGDLSAALPKLVSGCDAGLSSACLSVGKLYYEGQGVAQDLPRSFQSFEKACKELEEACYQVALMLDKGQGTAADPAKAFPLFTTQCDAGQQEACYHLANLYQLGRGIEADASMAKSLYQTACKAGIHPSCSQYGILLIEGGDLTTGSSYVKTGCDAGDSPGCVALGELYLKGKGVPKEIDKARKIFERACADNVGVGCYQLGMMMTEGVGQPADLTTARSFFEQGCSSEHGKSCGQLAHLYKSGRSVDKSMEKAVSLFDKACDNGDPSSCQEIAEYYYTGTYVQKDEQKALRMYRQICLNNDGNACLIVGNLIVSGVDGDPDYAKASEAFTQACAAGLAEGCAQAEKVIFPGKYEALLSKAFDSKQCTIWTFHEYKKENLVEVLRASETSFTVLAGPNKGQEFSAAQTKTQYTEQSNLHTAQSYWNVSSDQKSVVVEHHEDWHTSRMDIKDFPWVESYSKDPLGKESVFYTRRTETLRRNIGRVCTFPDEAKILKAEECSELQALIGAQLLSDCK